MTAAAPGALLVIAAMVLAPLTPADARMIAVSNCNGGMSLLIIPGDGDGPGKSGSDCAKACHAMTERRSKGPGKTPGPHC